MTFGGPAGESGYSDASTVPLIDGTIPRSGRHPGGQEAPWPGIPRRTSRPRRFRRRLRRTLTVLVALALVATVAFIGAFLVTPSVSNAPALARSFDAAHHVAYPGPPVPPRFAAALVSTEDHRFYSEPGIDPFAIGRVIRGRIVGQPDQGGATLYQQLAKMLYTPGGSGVWTELEQIMLGIKLDVSYTKAEILRLYAEVTYFGHGYYGLAAASCGYFGVTPAGLSWPQAAMLAGLVQAPSADSPLAHYSVARAREAHVLGRLAATGQLTQAQASQAYRQPLHLVGGPGTGCTG